MFSIRWKKSLNTPGAIAHEDAFPYGQRAVVPHQQKVEDFISDSKQKRENETVSPSLDFNRSATITIKGGGSISPIVEEEEAGYCSKHQDYCHIKLKLLILVFVGKSK